MVLALALLCPALYERWQILRLAFYDNEPERLPLQSAFKSQSILFADRVRSCEDVLLLEEQGLAIVACDPGRERWNTVMVRFLFPDDRSQNIDGESVLISGSAGPLTAGTGRRRRALRLRLRW